MSAPCTAGQVAADGRRPRSALGVARAPDVRPCRPCSGCSTSSPCIPGGPLASRVSPNRDLARDHQRCRQPLSGDGARRILDLAVRRRLRRNEQRPRLRRLEERGDQNRHIAGGVERGLDVTMTGIDIGSSRPSRDRRRRAIWSTPTSMGVDLAFGAVGPRHLDCDRDGSPRGRPAAACGTRGDAGERFLLPGQQRGRVERGQRRSARPARHTPCNR